MASFYERVLPATGIYTLLSGETGPGSKLISVRNWNGLKTLAELEAQIQRLSLQPLNIFYGQGTFAGPNRNDPVFKKAFWLDLDSKDLGSKENAHRELTVFIKATGLPQPSIIVDSGNGLHVYWCLTEDLAVDDWLPIAQALKAKCLDLGFKADPSATADPKRLMRCPGTLNRKGHAPIPCQIIVDNNTTYTPNDLAKQLEVYIELSDSYKKLKSHVSNEDLVTRQDYENVSDHDVRSMLAVIQLPPAHTTECRDMWIKVLMAIQDWSEKSQYGFEIFAEWSATQPGYTSEAECYETWESFEPGGGIRIGTLIMMAREAGWGTPQVPAPVHADAPYSEQIAAITMPVPAAQPALANRMIQQVSSLYTSCKSAVDATGKDRFNLSEAVAWLGHEFVIILEQEGIFYSLSERTCLSKQVINDLLTRFMPMGKKREPYTPTQLLRNYGMGHITNCLGFYPGQPVIYAEAGKKYVNLWNEPAPFIEPTDEEIALVNDLWDYSFPTEEDRVFGNYLMGFYGFLVQHPSEKITSAPLIISEKTGTGKTTLIWDIPSALVGHRNATIVSNKALRSQFSDWIEGTQLIYCDEIHINGRWDSDDTANALKNLITGKKVEVHPKQRKAYNIPNRTAIVASSNYVDAMFIPREDERRWGIYYLRPTRIMTDSEQHAYFKRFHTWLESPRGPGVLRHIFATLDVSNFDPHAPPPLTEAKKLMVEKSQLNEVQLVIDAARTGKGPFSQPIWTALQVGQWLSSETAKTYPGMTVRGFIERALPQAQVVNQIRMKDAMVGVWCLDNADHWRVAGSADIRKALGISGAGLH